MGYVVKGMRQADNLVTLDGSMVSETNGGIVMRGNPDAIAGIRDQDGALWSPIRDQTGGSLQHDHQERHQRVCTAPPSGFIATTTWMPGTSFPERHPSASATSMERLPGDRLFFPDCSTAGTRPGGSFPTLRRRLEDNGLSLDWCPLRQSGAACSQTRLWIRVTGQPFPNNTIPSGRFDPVTQKLISLYPSIPTRTSRARLQPGQRDSSSPNDIEEYIVKMDFRTGPDSRWSGRFYWYDTPITRVGPHSPLHSDRPASELRSEHHQYAQFRRQRGQRGRSSLLPKALLSGPPALEYGSELLKQPGHRRLADQGPGF